MDLSRNEKLEQLDRLLQSQTLHGSENLKAFLRFVVLKSVDNLEGDVKEYTIATEVFGRRSGYDSRSDSVVRVQASRLRAKLQEYYSKEGKLDKVLIELPKGHYTPVFSYAQGANGQEEPVAVLAPPTIAPASQPRPPLLKASNIIIAALALLSLALVILALNYRSEARKLSFSGPAGRDELQALSPLWDSLLDSPEPILVAFSNALFQGTAETGMKLLKPMEPPGHNFNASAKPDGNTAADGDGAAVTQHYTGVGEVMGVYALADVFARAGRPFRVKRSLLLTWDDLKTENIIVLGSPAENLLLRDLPQEQDFVFRPVKDDKQNTTLGIVNTKPRAGEQEVYVARQEGPSRSQISEDYAVVSLLRGLDEKHRLLILAGITTFGTQASAEYVTKPEYVRELIARLNLSADGDTARLPSYFQVLIKVKVNGSVPVQISYVTHHVL